MIQRILDRSATVLLVLGCGMTLLMMLHVTADVVMKFAFGRPLIGTLEVVTYVYMVGCIFLPLAAVQRQKGQILVEVFTHSLPPRALAGMDAVVSVVSGFFVLFLAWQGTRYAWLQSLDMETTKVAERDMPIWYARWFPAVSFIVCGAYLLLQAQDDARFALTGRRSLSPTAVPPRQGDF